MRRKNQQLKEVKMSWERNKGGDEVFSGRPSHKCLASRLEGNECVFTLHKAKSLIYRVSTALKPDLKLADTCIARSFRDRRGR